MYETDVELSRLRDERLENGTARARAAAGLLVVGLQQKLLSSIEAFAISLARHRAAARKQWEQARPGATALLHRENGSGTSTSGREPAGAAGKTAASGHDSVLASARLFSTPPDADDERAEYSDDEREAEEAVQIDVINAAAEGDSAEDAEAEAIRRKEEALLARMEEVASAARGLPDAKTRRLIDWIRENLCPELRGSGEPSPGNAGVPPSIGGESFPSLGNPPATRDGLPGIAGVLYEVRARRVEPIGLVYLWPDTG